MADSASSIAASSAAEEVCTTIPPISVTIPSIQLPLYCSSSSSSSSSATTTTSTSVLSIVEATLPRALVRTSPHEMPQLGLGTYTMRGEECAAAVAYALKRGYRHIDTASVYRNEEKVAEGIARSGVPREDIFLVSKLKPQDHGLENTYKACLESLKRLSTTYLDLFLVHWPGVAGKDPGDVMQKQIRKETWISMQRLVEEGHVRAIGVSNYMPRHLQELVVGVSSDSDSDNSSWVTIKPAVNQFELHPLLQQRDIVEACHKHGIAVESYATLARGSPALLAHSVILKIASAAEKTPAQVCLRWAIQKGYIVIPKSTHTERLDENLRALSGRDLTREEMTAIDALEMGGASGGEDDVGEEEEKKKKATTDTGDGGVKEETSSSSSMRTCWDPSKVA